MQSKVSCAGFSSRKTSFSRDFVIWVGFGAEIIACTLVTAITSRSQFPGSLTLSCMRTIAYCTQNFHKSATKAKNTAQTQKRPAADDESTAELHPIFGSGETNLQVSGVRDQI